MNLLDLAAAAPQAEPPRVPAWTLGCFKRRSITFASGSEDATTRVIWIQSHGLTGDIRVRADRPDVSHRAGVADCTREELAALCLAEGGVAETRFAEGLMRWDNWCAFQPYDKWPEPGRLQRVGACLIEFAPSGAYVEDWRLQADASGPLVGLRLVDESDGQGPGQRRDGGLVIAGDHAILALGRTLNLPSDAPLPEQMQAAAYPADLARRVFSGGAHYARRDRDGAYRIALSTDPFAAGRPLVLEGFAPLGPPGLLRQECCVDGAVLRRTWRIDTLLPDVAAPVGTPARPDGAAWLERERPRLLTNA